MSRNKELAKNTLILTIGKICTQFVSFLLLPLYTAMLNPEEFGIVDLFNTYITLLTPIFNWQFESGLFRFLIDYRQQEEKKKSLFSTVVSTNVLQIAIYLIFFLIFGRFISSEYKIFLALDVALNIILNTLLQFPRGIGKNAIYSFASFLSATVTVSLNVLFIACFKWGAFGMFCATMLSKLLTCLYLILATKAWKYFSVCSIDYKMFRDVLKYSIPLVPNQLSWWVVGASDRTIISHFISVAANGIYSVSNKFSAVYITFYNIFNLSWTESVSLHMNDNDRDEFLTDIINTMFKLFAAVDIGIIAVMPFIFDYMVGENYRSAYEQIPILMLAVLFQVIVGLYSVIYVALKKSSEIAKTSIFAAIINIVVDFSLINFIGLYAASISTLVAYVAMGLYRYFDVKKYVTVRLELKNVFVTLVVGIIAVLAYYSKNLVCCIISLFIVCAYSIIMNKTLLYGIIRKVSERIIKR